MVLCITEISAKDHGIMSIDALVEAVNKITKQFEGLDTTTLDTAMLAAWKALREGPH